ncbi:MAG: DUF5615 family PIN-like protein [Cyclobacteriaceae bacterium]|nr:DUF5615 family PIN-like protein [Cyclobacteriaceae bacterium]
MKMEECAVRYNGEGSFSNCQQVRFAGLENASDFQIFQFARANNFAVVTFDSDFIDLNAMYGSPPKVVYLNTGNLTTKNISDLLLDNSPKIIHYLEFDSDDILELIKAP